MDTYGEIALAACKKCGKLNATVSCTRWGDEFCEYSITCKNLTCWDNFAIGNTKEEAATNWNNGNLKRAIDQDSFKAGLEAAAKLFEQQAALAGNADWQTRLYEMADEIRAIEVPQTADYKLPQRGEVIPQKGEEGC